MRRLAQPVTLDFDRTGIQRARFYASPEVKAVGDDDARVLRFQSTAEEVDRYGDIVMTKGREGKNYRKNPVFLNGHWGGVIGKSLKEKPELDRKIPRLLQDVEFAGRDISPEADVKYKLYRGGFMSTVSIGFNPLKIDRVEDPERRKEIGLGQWGVVYERWEHLETSAVEVPALPSATQLNALREMVERGVWDSDDMDVLEWTGRLCDPIKKTWQEQRGTVYSMPDALGRWFEGAGVSRGAELAAVLRDAIEAAAAADDDTTEEDVVEQMVEESELEADEVIEIVEGSEDCPSLTALESFASVLEVPLEDLRTAAESDGCSFDDEGEERSALADKARAASQVLAELAEELSEPDREVRVKVSVDAGVLEELGDRLKAIEAALLRQDEGYRELLGAADGSGGGEEFSENTILAAVRSGLRGRSST